MLAAVNEYMKEILKEFPHNYGRANWHIASPLHFYVMWNQKVFTPLSLSIHSHSAYEKFKEEFR